MSRKLSDVAPALDGWKMPLRSTGARPGAAGKDDRDPDLDAYLADGEAEAAAEPSLQPQSPQIESVMLAGEAERGLVGRQIERRALAYALTVGVRPVLLVAPAGRGKSALVDVIAAEFVERDYEVLVLDIAQGASFADVANTLGKSISPESGFIAGRAAPRPLLIMIDGVERLPNVAQRDALLRLAVEFRGDEERARWCLIGRGRDPSVLFSAHMLASGPADRVPLPLMSDQEIARVAQRLVAYWQLEISPGALRGIVFLSRGLPGVTVRLCEAIACMLATEGRGEVTLADLDLALPHVAAGGGRLDVGGGGDEAAGERSQAEIILLACARAPNDADGCFGLAEAEEELRRMPCDEAMIRRMAGKLRSQLLRLDNTDAGSPIVVVTGSEGDRRYAFADDRVPVHLLMRAFAGGGRSA